MATKLPAANKVGKVLVILGIGGGSGEQMETAMWPWIPLSLELHVT